MKTLIAEFPLSETPLPDTIQVWVNQVERPVLDWTYEPSTNTVFFVLNPPRPGDQVDVLYEVAGQ